MVIILEKAVVFEDELTNEDVIARNKTKREKSVSQYLSSGELVCIFKSAREASLETGIHYNSIARCCRKERKTAGGFIWKHCENI